VKVKRWRVCSSSWVNILLEIPSLGYNLHGHDVKVEVCLEGERKGVLVFDIEEIKRVLDNILARLEKRRLSKVLGTKDASLEDLSLYVCRELSLKFKDFKKLKVKSQVPHGSVEVECESSEE
jgi:6-pyruvoyl-tetrahydropterin synthase